MYVYMYICTVIYLRHLGIRLVSTYRDLSTLYVF